MRNSVCEVMEYYGWFVVEYNSFLVEFYKLVLEVFKELFDFFFEVKVMNENYKVGYGYIIMIFDDQFVYEGFGID